MAGRYYEEFNVGDVFFSRSRTITETDIVLFTQLSWDTNPLHTDDEWCKANTNYGGKIAQGLLGLSAASGLISQLGHLEGTALGFLGMTWKYTGIIKAGDTLTIKVTILSKRETSNPERGILTREIILLNQRKEEVQKGEFVVLIKRKPTSDK